MKQLTLILIILVVLAGAGFFAYSRMVKKSGALPMGQVTITPGQNGTSGFTGTSKAATMPSPLPTVSEIPLTITSPSNGSSVTTTTLIVRGVTSPKADVFVNDSSVVADAQGNFTAQVTLDEGDNTIVVTANDANGNYSEKDITVTYSSGQ